MIIAERFEGPRDPLAMLGPIDDGERPGGIRPRDIHRLPLPGAEMVAQVANPVLYDAAQPAGERPLIGALETVKRLMGRQVGLLKYVAAFDVLPQLRSQARPDE